MSACSFTGKNGACKGRAVTGSDYCVFHQPKPPSPETQFDTAAAAPEPEPERDRRPGEGTRRPLTAQIDPSILLENQRERQREQAEWMNAPAEESAIPTDMVAARLAVIMHEHEHNERERLRRRGQPQREGREAYEGFRLDNGDPALKHVPVKMLTRRSGPDPTRIIDPITKRTPEALRPDWVQEWVSITDWQGNPTEHRIAELEGYGYEFIPDAQNRPIEGRLGVAMQGPPEAKAQHILAHTLTGAMRTRDDSLAAADSYAQAINRRAGDQVVTIVPERDHGEKRTTVPLGKERLYDV
jgi:hypothetical protein